MHAPGTPGLELPGMDVTGIAASYGIRSERAESLADLARIAKDALAGDEPRLIEIPERRMQAAD